MVREYEAIAYLLQLDRALDLRHVLREELLECLLINGLSYAARHPSNLVAAPTRFNVGGWVGESGACEELWRCRTESLNAKGSRR